MKLAYVEDNVKVDSFYNWYAPAPPVAVLAVF